MQPENAPLETTVSGMEQSPAGLSTRNRANLSILSAPWSGPTEPCSSPIGDGWTPPRYLRVGRRLFQRLLNVSEADAATYAAPSYLLVLAPLQTDPCAPLERAEGTRQKPQRVPVHEHRHLSAGQSRRSARTGEDISRGSSSLALRFRHFPLYKRYIGSSSRSASPIG